MERIAVFPGSFDPFTVGHVSIVTRAKSLFDKIIIAIGQNSGKSSLLTVENRIRLISDVFANDKIITVASYKGLTVDFCKEVNARYLLRGLRTAADFEYERAISQVNKLMLTEIESVFLLTLPEHTPINSTIVRDILVHKGNASKFLPKGIDINNYL
ncbi:MAG: pantetheine-phosphate adenylyltransferase [Bacteroidales bacterium]|nr:pantetheine-phosphate adenylyltransferase [Bacteroidales bacterium]MCF8390249.1 pantetheine-phosphate adenylyltransferase [Bacteroidales bacterium]